MLFYSVPTSPTRGMLNSYPTTTATNPNTYDGEDTNFHFDDFEFETSGLFNFNGNIIDDSDSEIGKKCDNLIKHNLLEETKTNRRQHNESLPSVAFADELFSDGKVMPMQLNPPPCQQGNYNISNPSSPQSTLFKIPYLKRSLWNDDFDPFMVALENVKEEKKLTNHRRAWSMLPVPACSQWQPDDLLGFEHENCMHANAQIFGPNKEFDRLTFPTNLAHCQRVSLKLNEPKGVLFARRARMVKMGYEGPTKTDPVIDNSGSLISETNCKPENKWQKIMSFALRSSTMKKTSDEYKGRNEITEFSRPKILRKSSFRSKKIVQCNEGKQVSDMSKMSIVRYRPKLLLCMGYGAKYAK